MNNVPKASLREKVKNKDKSENNVLLCKYAK